MKKRYETPELEVLLFDLREIAMIECVSASKNTDATFNVYPDFAVWNDFQGLSSN